jgi:hypothetical protein
MNSSPDEIDVNGVYDDLIYPTVTTAGLEVFRAESTPTVRSSRANQLRLLCRLSAPVLKPSASSRPQRPFAAAASMTRWARRMFGKP